MSVLCWSWPGTLVSPVQETIKTEHKSHSNYSANHCSIVHACPSDIVLSVRLSGIDEELLGTVTSQRNLFHREGFLLFFLVSFSRSASFCSESSLLSLEQSLWVFCLGACCFVTYCRRLAFSSCHWSLLQFRSSFAWVSPDNSLELSSP